MPKLCSDDSDGDDLISSSCWRKELCWAEMKPARPRKICPYSSVISKLPYHLIFQSCTVVVISYYLLSSGTS